MRTEKWKECGGALSSAYDMSMLVAGGQEIKKGKR